MSIAAFMGDQTNNDYLNENRLGFAKPKSAVSYLSLADDIENVGVSYTTNNVHTAKDILAIMKLTYSVFGPKMTQMSMYNSKTIGPMTLRFIKETESFVFTDTPRDIDIRTWDTLLDGPDLSLSLVNVVKRVDNNETRDVSFNPSIVTEQPVNIMQLRNKGSDSEYLTMWAARPNGILDMLLTLQHCYGKQSLARSLDTPQE